ncbi:MAG: GntR family transcriptional regulator [Hyphomicrobiales bacterium]
MYEWNKNQPIFLQIRQIIIEMILNKSVKSGEALPSVRQLATELSVNPLTVTKAYQSLVDMEIIEKKRGLGMFVMDDSQERLLKVERETFLKDEWPQILKRLDSLGIKLKELVKKEQGAV